MAEAKKINKNTDEKSSDSYIAVIRVRGEVNIRGEIKDTMRMLSIPNKHNMAIHMKTPAIMGMIKKAVNYITFGEVSKEVVDKYGLKQTVAMHPPRGGFERKGIKIPFKTGGALGYRGDKMSLLIEKMSPTVNN